MTEMLMLTLSALLYQFIWVPVSIAKYQARGMKWIESNRSTEGIADLPSWGKRARRAQANYIENFLPFAVAVLMLGYFDRFNFMTTIATTAFFFARLSHATVYIIGWVYVRTLSWAIGLLSTLYLYFLLITYFVITMA